MDAVSSSSHVQPQRLNVYESTSSGDHLCVSTQRSGWFHSSIITSGPNNKHQAEVGIMNMSANPDHPFHVAVGNNKAPLGIAVAPSLGKNDLDDAQQQLINPWLLKLIIIFC